MKNILTILILITLNIYAASSPKTADDIDHISLATLLLKDGHTLRAQDELSKVNLESEGLDFVKFYTLKGLILTKQASYNEANIAFEKSIEVGQIDKTIYLYVAQNSFKLKEYQKALDSIDSAGNIIEKKASIYALKAECNWQLNRKNEALTILKESIKRFPKEYGFYKQRFNYFVMLKLYQSALNDADFYLKKAEPNEKTSMAFISTLRKSGEVDKAISFAEIVNIKFPKNAEVTVLLAHLYLDKEMLQSAANLFDEASIEDSKYTKEAAEMMRRAKKFIISLYKNSQMLDSKEKLKQRIAIYLEYGAYERVVVSKQALYRTELIQDESIRYALAFSYYKIGDFSSSEKELKMLTSSDLFQQATEIRKNMQICTNNYWECDL